MEIEQLRKELTHLLDNVVSHSRHFSEGKQIPSLEISVVLAKINRMQEYLAVLKHLLEKQEINDYYENKTETTSSVKSTDRSSNKDGLYTKEKETTTKEKEKLTTVKPQEAITQKVDDEQHISSVSEKLQQTLTGKLIDAFTLNDRYLYANELFNKDMAAFNELIKTLDNCDNKQEVHQILLNTKIKFSWEDENEHYVSFTEIISRKFS